jgi:hypothetical protein
MSVYVGIDVHRKRSQVAVVTDDGAVQVNRNVPNGVEPILKVIGGLPVAFEAAYGWGWLVELLRRRSSASSSYVLARSSLTGCGRSNWTPPTRRRD